MDTLIRPIITLHGVTNGVLATGISDLTDQSAKARSRSGAGPSIAWTIGHLCHYRIKMLGLLGLQRENPFAAQFDDRPASDGADYQPSPRPAIVSTHRCQERDRTTRSASWTPSCS